MWCDSLILNVFLCGVKEGALRGARAPACSNHLAPAPLNPSGVAGMIFKVIGTASMSIGSSDSLYFFSSFQSVPSLVCGATALLACYRHQTPSHQIDT